MADPFAAVLRDPLLERAYHHWQGLRRGRPMPAPRNLDPVDIPSLLPFVVLTEPAGPGAIVSASPAPRWSGSSAGR